MLILCCDHLQANDCIWVSYGHTVAPQKRVSPGPTRSRRCHDYCCIPLHPSVPLKGTPGGYTNLPGCSLATNSMGQFQQGMTVVAHSPWWPVCFTWISTFCSTLWLCCCAAFPSSLKQTGCNANSNRNKDIHKHCLCSCCSKFVLEGKSHLLLVPWLLTPQMRLRGAWQGRETAAAGHLKAFAEPAEQYIVQ